MLGQQDDKDDDSDYEQPEQPEHPEHPEHPEQQVIQEIEEDESVNPQILESDLDVNYWSTKTTLHLLSSSMRIMMQPCSQHRYMCSRRVWENSEKRVMIQP